VSFVHSSASKILVNEVSSTAHVTGYTVTYQRDASAVTSLADSGTMSILGLQSGTIALRGLFDSAATSLYTEVIGSVGTDNSLLTTVFPDGWTIGQPALMAVSDISGFEVPASVSEAVSMTIDGTPDDGVDIGVSLHALSAETADGQGTSVDNAASSSNGGVANLHVTAYSGLTNVVFKVQASTDNSSWSDLITFATATATTSERKTVTGTVNRYLRAWWDVTGTGSATFTVAFARR
jgi:hypothetical protein